jgi:hypothetical protein
MPFPLSPRLLKGAIVAIDPFNPLASVVVFQYNPETLTRNLEPQSAGAGASPAAARRLKGAPHETITAELIVDATDQLEKEDPVALRLGIYPQLSALEIAVFPKSSLVIANTALSLLGTIEVIPPEAPLTLFVWGAKRVVPVQIESLSITEEAYDVNLNPIRARVSVSLRILTYDDLSIINPGYAIYLANQVLRETMAQLGSSDNLNAVIGGGVRLF